MTGVYNCYHLHCRVWESHLTLRFVEVTLLWLHFGSSGRADFTYDGCTRYKSDFNHSNSSVTVTRVPCGLYPEDRAPRITMSPGTPNANEAITPSTIQADVPPTRTYHSITSIPSEFPYLLPHLSVQPRTPPPQGQQAQTILLIHGAFSSVSCAAIRQSLVPIPQAITLTTQRCAVENSIAPRGEHLAILRRPNH